MRKSIYPKKYGTVVGANLDVGILKIKLTETEEIIKIPLNQRRGQGSTGSRPEYFDFEPGTQVKVFTNKKGQIKFSKVGK